MKDLLHNPYFLQFVEGIGYLILAFILFVLGRLAYHIHRPKIKIRAELVDHDNLAFALAHTGYFAGLLIVIGGAIMGPSNGFWIDILDISIYGLLAIVLLNISIFINDKIVLNKFSVQKEIIRDRNSGTGVVEGAMAITSGLIINGAIIGEADNLSFGIISAIVFWFLGQVFLVIALKLSNLFSTYNIQEQIEKDNVAVGIGFSGIIIAIGILIRFSVEGSFLGWGDSIFYLFFYTLIGLILLPFARFLCDKILLPGKNLTDELINQEKPNLGAAIIEAFAYISSAILITWSL
ncbi:MAG: DUF350 domain-containing protein [Bacteroidales bacterium]